MKSQRSGLLCVALASLGLGACSDPQGIGGFAVADCNLFSNKLFDGGPGRDGIPALTHPEVTESAEAGFLAPTDRVIGIVRNGAARAYPFVVMWWHEMVNDTVGGEPVLVTYCPLTGSGLAFDPRVDGEVFTFGVSGLIFENNLIMFDRKTESLWSQLLTSARCGSLTATQLATGPIVETTWERWVEMYPQTTVVTTNTGFSREYGRYPYGSYDVSGNTDLLFPSSPFNTTRPMKELTLGVVEGEAAVGYPFQALYEVGERAAVNDLVGDRPIVVFWDGPSETAIAYERSVDGQVLEFQASQSDVGAYEDIQTGSVWSLSGVATSGALAGSQLQPVEGTYNVFWFSWSVFHRFARLGVE